MGLKLLLVVTGLTLLAACAGLETLGANQISLSTKQSTEVELAHWAYWNDDCEGEDFSVAVAAAPRNGRTEIRESVFAIPAKTSSGKLTGCVDKIIESKKVFYIPNDGFVGTDAAVVKFSGSSGVVTNAYSISVK